MDTEQKNLITKHLTALLELTICSDMLLSVFQSRNILSKEDVEIIESAGKNYGNTSKCKNFYDIIQTRSESYDVLIDALDKTNQSGVLSLLQRSAEVGFHERVVADHLEFSDQPSFITEFLASKTKTVLIVNAFDCKISCDRLCETVPNSVFYDFQKFAKVLSKSRSHAEITNNLPVVNCENEENVNLMISFLKKIKTKIVVVAKYKKQVILPEHLVVNENIEWKDLSPISRFNILQNIDSKIGLQSTDCLPYLEKLDQPSLLQLIKGEMPSLFKNTIPELINFYIPRTILSRTTISPNIFLHDTPDIFVISGIERHQLSKLAAGRRTSTSSEVLRNGISPLANFIVLEMELHFDKIAKVLNHHSVHWLKFEGEKFIWIKSSNGIDIMQGYIDTNQTGLNEDEFVNNLIDTTKHNKDPVCISDTPGMGKSVLLTRVGAKLQVNTKLGSTGFFVIREIVDQIKQSQGNPNLNEKILHVVATNLCENMLGIAYFKKNKHELTDLLLDGFDEVSQNDIELAYNVIGILRDMFSSTRIWITTRPHMLSELERFLNTLGHNIEPFAVEDQVNFLVSFWSIGCNTITGSEKGYRLRNFAEQCLLSIKSKLNSDKERDIAGIPLQCRFIAEVFQEGALEFCENGNAAMLTFNVKSIFDLYKLLVEKKFQRFYARYDGKKITKKSLMNAHIYYSLRSLFPNINTKFVEDQKPKKVNFKDILNVGIIESIGTTSATRSIHRTLSEYFVAIFIVESFVKSKRRLSISFLPSRFSKKATSPADLTDFFLGQVLQTQTTSLQANQCEIYAYKFTHSVICYFVESHIKEFDDNKLNSIDNSMDQNTLELICEACAYSGFDNIFIKLFYPVTVATRSDIVYSESFAALCAFHAGEKMLSVVCDYIHSVKRECIPDLRFRKLSLLHFAVIRGDYSIFEQILKIDGFIKYIESGHPDFTDIIHQCAYNSANQDMKKVDEKVKIIKYIGNINPDLLTTYNQKGDLPIFSPSVHLELTKILFMHSKLPYELSDILDFLHGCLKTGNSDVLLYILEHIYNERGCCYIENLWQHNGEHSPLIYKLFQLMEPCNKLLEVVKNSVSNFTDEEDVLQSVLKIAIENQRSRSCITWLLKNIYFTEDQLKIAFMSSLSSLHIDGVSILLEGCHINLNQLTTDGVTNIFDLLFTRGTEISTKHCNIVNTLIEHGLDLNDETRIGCTPIEILVETIVTKSKQWWELFDLFLSITHSTNDNIVYRGVRFFLNQPSEEDKLLQDLLLSCEMDKNLNKTFKAGNTVLHFIFNIYSKVTHWPEICRILVRGGAYLFSLNSDNETPICKLINNSYSAWNERWEAIITVLESVPSYDIPTINNIIILTVRHGVIDVIENVCEWYLENVKKPINSIMGQYKGTSLTIGDVALLSCNGDVLYYIMVDHGCVITVPDNGSTIIHKCIETGNTIECILKFITLVNQLNPNLVNSPNEKGIVQLSANAMDSAIVRHLLKLGANVNAADEHGNTPLHYALRNNTFIVQSVVKELVKFGADVNAVTRNHETALMLSLNIARWGIKNVFKFLLERNADPGILDTNGNTVIHFLPYRVSAEDFPEIVDMLLKKGYMKLFYFKNAKRLTPFQIACQHYEPNNPGFQLIEKCRAQRNFFFNNPY